ncbi:hypothetical protein KBD45_02125 [Candidatus Dojkabacteria bacterium]|nr:hypothetical protein [Candidatus Dojkabacteria bacterium]
MNSKIYKILGFGITTLSLIIGLYTRVLTYTNFVSFGPDQIRDSKVYALMKEGIWPSLGPIAPLTDNLGFHLFPLYHYLIGTFTLFSKSLNTQLLINGILSFLAIPLFVLLNYRLLDNIEHNKRLMISSIGGIWFSIFVNDIVNTNLAWNPSPMLFFTFLFLLLVDKLHRVKNKISLIEHFLLWTILGGTTAFLISLHTWSMVTFIPAFLINCVYFTYFYIKTQKGRKSIYPFIGLLYLLMFLSTYIISEISSNWLNTQNMINVITNSSSTLQTSVATMISRPFTNILSMLERTYIIQPNYYFLALPFAIFLISFFTLTFKGNKFLLTQILLTVFIYSIGISFYSGEMKSRYQILIWYVPILFSISLLAYPTKNIFLNIFKLFYTIIFITTSIYFNWIYTTNFISRVYGNTKLIDTDEMTNILSSLPERSKLCYPWGEGYDYLPQLQFIDSYITKRNHKFENNCVYSEYYLYLKNIPNVNTSFNTKKNPQREYPESVLILEGLSFKVFKLQNPQN